MEGWGGGSVPKRKQVFQLVYLNCVIFYNEDTNVLLTIELNHVVHEEGGGGDFFCNSKKTSVSVGIFKLRNFL